MQLRVYAKKRVKAKFRDFKSNNRQFWNWGQAGEQYAELVTYIWKPSVAKSKELVDKYRLNLLFL